MYKTLDGEKTTNPLDDQERPLDDSPTSPYRRVVYLLSDNAPGLVLIAWTILPLSLALMFEDAISLLCIYPLLCPLFWLGIARWKPDRTESTIVLGVIGHILLITSLWFLLKNSGMGNNVGFDFVGILVLLALLVFSLLGSIITISFIGAKER